jgi:hypothetical protein
MENEENSLGLGSRKQGPTAAILSEAMNQGWRLGTFWFSLALASPICLFSVFYKQIQPRFIEHCPDHDSFHENMPWY